MFLSIYLGEFDTVLHSPARRSGRLCRLGIACLLLLTAGIAQADKKLRVVTTFTVIQDMARNIAGDAAEVHSITKPGAEIHGYQPTPRDIARSRSADLILWNGLHLERWFKRFFEHLPGVPAAVVSEGIDPLPIRQGPYHGNPNPHAWMSPGNALIYVENIRKALVARDPAHAGIYNRNAREYAAKITALDTALRSRLDGIPASQRWLVSSEGAFSYLARDYGLSELYLWPINAEEQGTPSQIRRVIDEVRRRRIPVVFSESTVSDKPARQVAKETGAHYGGVLYVDSLSATDGPVPTYLELLARTTDTIARGFGL
ncbi:metal ABC transporter substrate-binding protein [Martelella alba]|uniref:Metal ABC transporter substrate-binding protein n=1 Tax=Martelella alba TaxID=2590451 RepID=A0ABY2SGV7_9HYPH|nr:metal ABC transporter substrate-binding protein [Martelella alba]TKI03786.1 metal ABC transporter substrate-binding protein [Martelella alba]